MKSEVALSEAELEAKQAQDEMNEEIAEATIENIRALVPKEWQPKIDEMLPKILKLVKHALKGAIKNLSKELGENKKMFVVRNAPSQVGEEKKIYFQPRFYVIETEQLQAFKLKDGEAPKVNYPLAELAEKIESYKTVESLLADLNNGSLLQLTTDTKSVLVQPEEKKQIETPQV